MKRVAYKIANFPFNLSVKSTEILSKIIVGFALINILVLIPDMYDLYGLEGYIPSHINDEFMYAYNPLLSWLIRPFEGFGIPGDGGLLVVIGVYVCSLLFAFFRYRPLLFSIVAWIIHVMLVNSSYYFSYGADYFITFALLANVLLNIDTILKDEANRRMIRSFAVRFVQIQLCLVYFFAGFGKIIGFDWIDGNAMWYVMNAYSPEVIKGIMPALIDYPAFFITMCWAVLILELLYPALIYVKRMRTFTLLSVMSMHVGIMFIMGLYTFGIIMIILNYVAFGYYLDPLFSKPQEKITPKITPNMA